MRVNILQARSALLEESTRLNEMIKRKPASVDTFDQIVGDDALQGQFYDAAKTYLRCIAKPLYERFVEAARAKLAANMKYIDELNNLSAYGLVIDLERLLELREQLDRKIDALQRFSDANPVCFLIGYSSLDHLYEVSMQLEAVLRACYRFQLNTAGCYDESDARIAALSSGIAAAKSVCDVKGGMYSFGDASVGAWAKISGQEMDLQPSYCPDYASWDRMSEEDRNVLGPPPGSPGYVENSYEQARKRDGGWTHVCTWNGHGELSCTFYTLWKLRERGLGYPFINDATNGRDWFRNCDESVPGAEGARCLEILYDQYGELTNVVVCFPTDPEDRYGHVVLIERVYRSPVDGKLHVVFDDERRYDSPDGTFRGYDGKRPVEDMTYDEFLARYRSWGNGEPTGARYLGGPTP